MNGEALMHSSRNAASTGPQHLDSSRASRISFPPTPRFGLPVITDSCSNRSDDQKANLMRTWDEARNALNILPLTSASER